MNEIERRLSTVEQELEEMKGRITRLEQDVGHNHTMASLAERIGTLEEPVGESRKFDTLARRVEELENKFDRIERI